MGKLADLFRQNLISTLGENWGAKTAFVQKAGFARPTLERWLKGERVPDLDQLEKVATALDLNDPCGLISKPEDRPWAKVPKHLLVALAQVHPDHYPIVVNFLRSFSPVEEDSKLPKGFEKPGSGRNKSSKKNAN